jgi:tetratricopeptide (TPR) repeat protein
MLQIQVKFKSKYSTRILLNIFFFLIFTETRSLKEKSGEQYPIRNLKEDQARFLWFYKCHNFMIELEDDDRQAKQEMISCCRQNYQEDKRALKTLDEFENQSFNDNAKNAILWYTQNSIIFRCINEALISGNISTIYSYRYIIKLLCRQLKYLHEKYKQSNSDNILRLYRGQLLKLSQILLISKHINDLISLNGFLSTSLEEDIAKRFCFVRQRQDHEPVLFEIDIDMTSEQSIAFADISHISQYPEEEEILISIGSIFRIESVDFDEINQLYRIHLSLSQYEQLTVNQYIEQTFAKEVDSIDQSVLFGKLLFDMGEYQFAIEYFKKRIECLTDTDNHHRATYLNNIGVCYNEIGKKDQALKHYKAASQMYKQTNNHRGLGACYHNVNY